MELPKCLSGKECTCQCRRHKRSRSIPESGRSPGIGDGNLLQYSCLGSSIDRGAWQAPVHGDSPGKNTGVGCHALLQGIFPAHGSNSGLLHCRWILYHLSHQRSHILILVFALFSRWFLRIPKFARSSCFTAMFLFKRILFINNEMFIEYLLYAT